jgi:hypothetical protein
MGQKDAVMTEAGSRSIPAPTVSAFYVDWCKSTDVSALEADYAALKALADRLALVLRETNPDRHRLGAYMYDCVKACPECLLIAATLAEYEKEKP